MGWQIEEVQNLSFSSLLSLFQNEIAVLRVPSFLPQNTCEILTEKIHQHGIEPYIDDPDMARIGITQAEHMHDKDLYFLHTAEINSKQEEIFQEIQVVLSLVINALRTVWKGKVEVAVEETSQQIYFAGLIRAIKRTKLHFDWAPHDAKGWTIGRTSAQLAWNIYVHCSKQGGITKVYRRPWEDQDEPYRLPGSYAFDPVLVKDAEWVEIHPLSGELVLFNSRNYHEVEHVEDEEERLSISAFIGLLAADQKLLLWS